MRLLRRGPSAPVPAERTWMHPSELPGSFEHATLPPTRVTASRRFQSTVAATATALLATGVMLLVVPTGTPQAGATIGPHIATSVAGVPRVDRGAASAMLALVIDEGMHLGTATALVVPPGAIAVTTTPLPAGASVMAVRPGEPNLWLTVIGTDTALGVTVLRLPSTTVPVTPIASLTAAVNTGGAPTALTALTAVRGATTPVQFEYAPAYLNSASSSVGLGGTAISVTHGVSLAGVVAGTLVVNPEGQAVAMSVPALGPTTFVSAQFISLLAQRIALGDSSGHGWLQIAGTVMPTGLIRVTGVEPHGASAGALRLGDTILAIDSQPVRSIADIGTILYTSSPGQHVTLTVLRGDRVIDVVVHLAASP